MARFPRSGEQRTPLRELMDPTRPPAASHGMLRFPRWDGEGAVADDPARLVAVIWEVVPPRFISLMWTASTCTLCSTPVGEALVSGATLEHRGEQVVVPDGLWEAVRRSTFDAEGQDLIAGDLGRELLVMDWHRPSVCLARQLRESAATRAGD